MRFLSLITLLICFFGYISAKAIVIDEKNWEELLSQDEWMVEL
jgi:hypothetical protein